MYYSVPAPDLHHPASHSSQTWLWGMHKSVTNLLFHYQYEQSMDIHL